MITDDKMLVKLKQAGLSNLRIAQRLGITEADVEVAWKRIIEAAETAPLAGHDAMQTQYTVLCHQYQLLGESLKIIAGGIGNAMSPSEIRALLTTDPEQSLQNLLKSCIILRPFTPVDPCEAFQKTLEGN